MTFAIGNNRIRSGSDIRLHRQGFTLIELMLVMAMLLIVLGVAFPSLKNFFRGRNLDSEARRFLSLTHYAQSRAVSEGVPMVVWIDARQKSYGLKTQAGYTDFDNKAVEVKVDEALQVEISAPRSTGRMRSSLSRQSVPGIGNVPMIRFTPDGFIGETSPDQIVFRQDANDAVSIALSANGLKYEIQPGYTALARR